MELIYPLNIQQKQQQQSFPNNYKYLQEYLMINKNNLNSLELNNQINYFQKLSSNLFIPQYPPLIQQQILEINENNIRKMFWEFLQNKNNSIQNINNNNNNNLLPPNVYQQQLQSFLNNKQITTNNNFQIINNYLNNNSSQNLNNQLESLSRNKLGRSYNPGRPLGILERQRILELYQRGLKISHIAKIIGVTHSCVSKIMTRYRRTGSIHPRSSQLFTTPITTKNTSNKKEIFKYSIPSAFKKISFKKEIINNCSFNKEIIQEEEQLIIEKQKIKKHLIEKLIE
uniref:Paired domain-containing protein n=1 Tax=Meloidogyne floridensis TaxID=298350 RepID=A0A915NW98_9BILA